MKNTLKAVIAIVAVLALASAAFATMDFQKEINTKYPTAKAKCSTCHAKPMPKKGESELNVFGKDVQAKAIVDPKAAKKTLDLTKIEGLDSDGDGKTNVEELKAGTNPGDPASK